MKNNVFFVAKFEKKNVMFAILIEISLLFFGLVLCPRHIISELPMPEKSLHFFFLFLIIQRYSFRCQNVKFLVVEIRTQMTEFITVNPLSPELEASIYLLFSFHSGEKFLHY